MSDGIRVKESSEGKSKLIKGEDIVVQSDYMLLTSYLLEKNMIVFTLYTREGVNDKIWMMQEDFSVDCAKYEALAKKVAFLNMKYGGEIC